jgi:hypothetical protein
MAMMVCGSRCGRQLELLNPFQLVNVELVTIVMQVVMVAVV